MNTSDVELMKKQIENYESHRELLIPKSRSIVKLSKKVIYAIHRDDIEKAASEVEHIKKELAQLKDIAQKDPALASEGSFKIAIQEYVEALVYFYFVTENKLYSFQELNVKAKWYILGLCDVTGELGRRAVRAATKENYTEVVKIKDTVEDIFGVLLGFDFRDNETRRKFDSIKYDLKKLEDLVLDLKLKGKI